MKTSVNFRGFEGFDHLQSYVQSSFEHMIGRLDLGNVQEVKVIVGTNRSRRPGRSPGFSCEAVLKSRHRQFFVRKTDNDFQVAVRKCVKALSKVFMNTTRNRRDSRRRNIDHHQEAYDFNRQAIA
jgi:hypothetical protein